MNPKDAPQKTAYHYAYPRPALTVDCVVFGVDFEHDQLQLLLIKRALPPCVGQWALPGGFVLMDESLDKAAARELKEEAGLSHVFLEQLYTFGAPKRDPRGRVVSVAYYALVKPSAHSIRADTDARHVAWRPIHELPALAFDHQHIIDIALERLRAKVRYQPIGFELLPKKFTLSQLKNLYEVILCQKIDKRNFQRKFLSMGILQDTGEMQQNVAHRAAKYYTFDQQAYQELEAQGFEFAIRVKSQT